jgi:hypothetical protein
MQRETKIIIVLIVMMAVSFWLNPVKARSQEIPKGFHFGLSEKMEVKDSQKYLRPIGDGEVLVGTGACYGPFFSASYQSRWLADALSVCALGAVSQAGESKGVIGMDIINILGLQFGVEYDPQNSKPFYAFGISVTGLANQLLK